MRLSRGTHRIAVAAEVGVALTVCACTGSRRDPSADAPLTATDPIATRDFSRGAGWRYFVRTDERADELEVEASFENGSSSELSVAIGAEPYVSRVRVVSSGVWRTIAEKDASWPAPECQSGCRVRYVYRLRKAAEDLDDVNAAAVRAGAIVAPPSTWLLRPIRKPTAASYELVVETPPEIAFVAGAWRNGTAYGGKAQSLVDPPYAAFGAFQTLGLRSGNADLEVAIAEGGHSLDEQRVLAWVGTAARAVTAYYGAFPVPRALVLVLATEGSGLGGKQLGTGGASVLLRAGTGATARDYATDWTATHELLHLATPSMARRHLWLAEGVSTYVEPIARVQIGELGVEKVWRDLAEGLPKGQPRAGDRGLDHTPTWGRTYWGGALFCFLADIEIRRRTENRKGLGDALIGVLRAGGDVSETWTIERFLEEADRAATVPVLSELYRAHASRPERVDLSALFARLGVRVESSRVHFDDTAPLAHVRRAMIRASGPSAPSARLASDR